MTNEQSATRITPAAPSDDLTGRNKMAANVLASWAGYSVFVVAGFVMPRLIDRQIGQDALGVWDFAWSLIAYFGLVQAGIGSSVNRFVAQYRAVGDSAALNGVVNSVSAVLLIAGAIALLLTGLAVYVLPDVWGNRLGALTHEAQWVVFLLGTSLAVQMAFAAFAGVITGCHRWDLHNAIHAGWHAAIVAAMVASLYLGQGLRALALCNLTGLLLADLTRVAVAFHLCRGLRLSPRFVHGSVIRQMLAFGGKTVVPRVAELLLNQTAALLITLFLGPAALALYARPMSLVRHVGTAVHKFAFVLTPTASALQATDQLHGLRDLLIKATRYGAFISFPLVLVLVIMGGPLMVFWMGTDYADAVLVAVLAVGSLPLIISLPAMSILAGLNAHGRPGVAHLVAALSAAGLVLLVLGYLEWGLTGVALAIGIPIVLVYGLYVPVYACRRLRLPVGRYLVQAFSLPLLCVAPFAACLLASRLVCGDRPLLSLGLGLSVGGLVLACLYWQHVLPRRYRRRILRVFGIEVRSA